MSTHNTAHVANALARLKQQFKGQANVAALLTALVTQGQAVEDALWQLLTERGIDAAVGAQLDALGAIVGQPRAGRLDDAYRRFITARISTNKSNGIAEDVLTVSQLVLDLTAGTDATFNLYRSGVASLILQVIDSPISDDDAILLVTYFLRDVAAAGVRMLFEYSTVITADQFFWDSSSWDGGLIWGTAVE